MPINPSALSSPEPDDAAKERQDASAYVAETQQREEQAQPQRKRRTKAELIADAVVPAADAPTEVKDAGTGAKVQRPWAEAVALVKAGKAEFADKALKYAVLKMEQEPVAASGAFGQPAQPSDDPAEREVRYTAGGQVLLKTGGGTNPDGDSVVYWSSDNGEHGGMTTVEWDLLSTSPPPREGGAVSSNVPPDAELGDEVRVGAETMRVGHGGVLTNSPVAVDGEVVKPKRRWQRELGTGANGPWQATVINVEGGLPEGHVFKPIEEALIAEQVKAEQGSNGNSGAPVVQTERLPHVQDEVAPGVFKISTGMLDKIGLPDYSSLQIGPITMSRMVQDDGRRHKEVVKGREVTVISAAVEAFEELDNTIEFVGARFRGQLQSFLESTGALKQPVS